MRKWAAIILAGLLALIVIAGAAKLMLPGDPVEPVSPADILTLHDASGAARPSAAPGFTAAPSPDIPAPAPEPSGKAMPSAAPTTKPSAAPTPTSTPAPTPTPAAAPTPPPTPAPSPTATPAATPGAVGTKPLAGLTIGVDPGHQAHRNHDMEPEAPGSTTMKHKVSSGTSGTYTRIAEHTVNLQVGLLLQKLLQDAGAAVVMTRETADVDISNVERAQLFNKKKVDLGIRLHCNGSTDSSVRGAFMLVPKDKAHPFYEENVRAAKCILEAYGRETGISTKKGITYRADQTGFNWCERPIVNIEMGHMTNKDEDVLLTDAAFQKKMAKGIFQGIVAYFSA